MEQKPAPPLPWPPGTDPAIAFQRELIKAMAPLPMGGNHAMNEVVCRDPATGEPLTYAELLERYSVAMLIIAEVEARAQGGHTMI